MDLPDPDLIHPPTGITCIPEDCPPTDFFPRLLYELKSTTHDWRLITINIIFLGILVFVWYRLIKKLKQPVGMSGKMKTLWIILTILLSLIIIFLQISFSLIAGNDVLYG